MRMSEIKKMGVNRRRIELLNNTSLEILKQKKINEASRVGGRFFSKHFVSLSVDEVLRSKHTFLIALKYVEVNGGWSSILTELTGRGLSISTVLSVANIRTLYAGLASENGLAFLFPYLASHSTYLLVMPSFEDYLGVVKYCLDVEIRSASGFLEILFVKEAQHFINFSLNDNKSEALELRKLYTERSLNCILLELNSRISNISVSFTGIFSISLLNSTAVIYPGRV